MKAPWYAFFIGFEQRPIAVQMNFTQYLAMYNSVWYFIFEYYTLVSTD